MSDETKPTRLSLATFLHGKPAPATAAAPAPDPTAAVAPAVAAEPEPTVTAALPLEAAEAVPAGADSTDESLAEHAPAAEAATPAGSTLREADTPLAGAASPSFMRNAHPTATPTGTTPRWQWGGVIALGLLLLLQIVVADRARLAADASTRPLVSAVCAVLRCSLPAWHEPSAYAMLSREIRPVPGAPGVLQVQASFRNEARWAQAWPALHLSLSDADGRVIGRRTLQPEEYLGAGVDHTALLEPGQSAQVSFRLREPAAATVAFSFEFQ